MRAYLTFFPTTDRSGKIARRCKGGKLKLIRIIRIQPPLRLFFQSDPAVRDIYRFHPPPPPSLHFFWQSLQSQIPLSNPVIVVVDAAALGRRQ